MIWEPAIFNATVNSTYFKEDKFFIWEGLGKKINLCVKNFKHKVQAGEFSDCSYFGWDGLSDSGVTIFFFF